MLQLIETAIKVETPNGDLLVSNGTDLAVWMGVSRSKHFMGVLLWPPLSRQLLSILKREAMCQQLWDMDGSRWILVSAISDTWQPSEMFRGVLPAWEPHGHMIIHAYTQDPDKIIEGFWAVLRKSPKGFHLFRRYRKQFKELVREIERVMPSWLLLHTLAGKVD